MTGLLTIGKRVVCPSCWTAGQTICQGWNLDGWLAACGWPHKALRHH